jgi:hypothetical protein
MNEYITRKEIARLLNIHVDSVRKMHLRGSLTADFKIKQKTVLYDRKQVMEWIKTSPVKHWGDNPPPAYVPVKIVKNDIYNLRKYSTNFQYSGYSKMIILFCRPALLCRHSYDL